MVDYFISENSQWVLSLNKIVLQSVVIGLAFKEILLCLNTFRRHNISWRILLFILLKRFSLALERIIFGMFVILIYHSVKTNRIKIVLKWMIKISLTCVDRAIHELYLLDTGIGNYHSLEVFVTVAEPFFATWSKLLRIMSVPLRCRTFLSYAPWFAYGYFEFAEEPTLYFTIYQRMCF